MDRVVEYQVGDILIQQGHAFKVIQIQETEAMEAGQMGHAITYKPCFETGRFKGLIRKIPIRNLSMASVRRVISKKKAEQILEQLSQSPKVREDVNIRTAKTLTSTNSISNKASLLTSLWLDKIESESKSLASGKQTLFEILLNQLTQELAIVFETDLEGAEALIRARLKLISID